ncbi:hypothetical protein GCM10017559_26440 [Streptosporangium longisporum]|uniref:Uncharacterized protein n=1 Tax=Streptosporangium longisporum TaxID=46187 RepID=A0ABN3XXE2_9ACTN
MVDRIEGRSVCGMEVGDCFTLERSAHLRLPDGKHFCVYALAAVLPFLATPKQRDLAHGDFSPPSSFFCLAERLPCGPAQPHPPDRMERLVMGSFSPSDGPAAAG